MMRWEPNRRAEWLAYEDERDYKNFINAVRNIVIVLLAVAVFVLWFMFAD